MSKKKFYLIFGCGYYGRAIFRKIKKKNVIFIDNNPKLKKIFGKKILLPEEIKNKKIPFIKIFLAGRYLDEQIPQLEKLKLANKLKIYKNYELKPPNTKLITREKKILFILRYIIKKFNENKINYWLDRSGLLAIERNQRLSEFSDIDISIDFRDYNKLKKMIKSIPNKIIIEKKIIKIGNKNINKYYLTSSKKYLRQHEPAIVDFIYRKIDNNYISSYGIDLKKIPINFIYPKFFFKYKGTSIKIPKDSKKYLNFIYGKNWKKKTKFYLKSSRV